MRFMHRPVLFVVMIAAFCPVVIQQRLAAQTQRQMPILQVDPYWPQFPENWIIGVGAGIATDAENNVWIVHRPGTVTEKKACCKPAPAVMEFSPSGKLLQSWSGVGEGYEWPLEKDEHGIFVDYKNNVWIAGRGTAFASVPVRNGTSENQILKFDNKGKFLLQIGRRGKGTGSNDTTNLGQPADIVVYPPTNEVFVADGYGNRRVIVFDADTGAYKRHWGAYGNRPDDKASKARQATGAGPQQFNTPHGVTISNDGVVYVADRANNRIQTFTIDGTFLKEGFVKRDSEGTGTAFGVGLSADPQQRCLYVADGSNERIAILDRKTLEEIGQIGRPGRKAGEFFHLHSLDVDPQGNIVTGESQGYRVQKFIYKGLSTTAR